MMKLKQIMFALVAMMLGFALPTSAQDAKVGNTEYATIDEAIANWTNGTTLTLLADVTLSDVIKLSSTEHHILDLGTYTMTAGVKKNSILGYTYETELDAIEIVCNGRSSASYALTVNADAANPGGITANGKSCIYYKKSGSTKDRPIILINNGVFNGSNSINSISNGNTNCPQIWINGGVFNGNVNLTKNLLQITGGTFHGSINCTGDVNAYRLISGGRFKSWRFMTNDNKNGSYDKFGIATSKDNYLNGNYNVGVYIDAEGYLVVGGAVIKELSPKYKAVVSYDNFKTTNQYNNFYYYLAQSSAATYGLFYEDAEMAIAKHGEANVTVWEKPAVTIPENVTGDAAVVEEIKNNTALNDYTPENLPEGAELEIELKSVGETIVYDVTPMANGAEVEPTEAITFRLPVPASVTNAYAKVYHEGTLMGLYTIKGEGNAKYVEISSANFSVYTVEPTTPVAKIGETAYETLSAAFAAVTNDNQTVVICKDVTENLTATLRGNITTENGAKVTITLTNEDCVCCPYTFVLGENVTMKVPALFYYAGGAQINGTLEVGAYYQRYAGTKLTINEPGSMTVTSETCIICLTDGDPNAGIYVVGDNNNETIGLKLSVAYFYQGMINAKNANIQAGVYWQTNETDGQGSANLFLDNSTLNVTVNEHDFKATGNSTVTLQNNSSINVAGGFVAGDNTTLNVDATSSINDKNGVVAIPAAKIGTTKYATLDEAFAAATADQTITLLSDATPALTSQRAITKAAVIDLDGKTLTLTEDDLYFGTTTFKNGTIVVDPSVKPSTAVFWMFAGQTLTFDAVKIVATGVTGTYLIGLDGNNSDLNIINGSEILVKNTTALDLDIICVNASTGNDIKVENSKVNVTNLDGRVFFRGNYTVKDSEVNLAGITKAGFRIEAGQTLSIEGTSKVNIEGEPRDGGIHLTDLSATYTKAETATVNATVNEPKVAKVGDNTYRTLAQAVAAVEDGGTITLIANETFTKNNRYNNGGYWDGLGYSGDKSFTIDLNGFTVSQDGSLNDYLFWFKNVGSKANTITIKNGTLDAGTTAYCALCTASSHDNQLTINTENLTLINNISNGSTIKNRAGAVLNVKDGTKIIGKNSYLGIENWKAEVNIYDGAEIYMNGTSSYNGCLVGVGGNGTINVYGGYGKGVKGGFIAMTSGGTINISGGEWIANTDGSVGNNSNLYVLTAQSNKYESGFAGPSIINVTGGTFRGGMDAWVLNNLEGEKAELNITGGNFNVDPKNYLEDGYLTSVNDGIYTVSPAVAKIGETLYATVQAAINAAKEGDVVEIFAGEYSAIDISNKNITIKGAVGADGELLTTIKGGNPAITAHGFNGTIKDIKIVDAFKVMYAEPAGNVTIDNIYVTGATYGLHLVAYSTDLTWTIQNSYMDLSWANSFGVYGKGDAAIVIEGNKFESTAPYYPEYGALLVNTFLPNVTVQNNIFGANTKIMIRESVSDLSNVKISENYHADGFENAFVEDSQKADIDSYYKAVAEDGTLQDLVNVVNSLEGEGTEASPYLIRSVDELVFFRDHVNASKTKYNAEGVYVALGDSINLAGVDWSVNIGDDCNATFDGIFDGKGHKIMNLTSTETAKKADGYICTGLFGAIYGNAVVKNLTVENVTINAPYAVNNVAAVVGFAYNAAGSIENVKVTGVKINAPNATGVGAIVGYDYNGSSLKVVNCEVDGSAIEGKSYVGGLVGYASSKIALNGNTVENVSVTATGSVGAIAGIMLAGGSADGNTVKNVALSATGELWANSVAVVAGTITKGSVTAANTTVENVTVNGEEAPEAPIVGGVLVEKPTTPIAKVEAKIGDVYFATVENAMASNVDGVVEIFTDMTINDADAKDYTYTKDAKVNGTLTYKRTLVADAWNPLYVPFALPMSKLIDNYDIAYYNDVHAFDDDKDGTYERTTIELIKITDGNAVLKANYPLIIRPKSAADYVLNLKLVLTEDVALSKAVENKITMKSASHDFEIMGTYSKRESLVYTETITQYALGREDGTGLPKWITTTKSVNPYRLILTVTSRGNVDLPFKSIGMRVIGDDSLTDIEGVEFNTNGEDLIFDLQGRRVLEPKKGGIYIINGKKVYFK